MKEIYTYLCIMLLVVVDSSPGLLAQNIKQKSIETNYTYPTEVVSDLSFYGGNINRIIQDDEGLIWIASWVGLFMYNGYEVRPYMPRPGFANCFVGRKIRALYSDSKGRVWVGSSFQGLHLFDRDSQCFIQFLHESNNPRSLPENDVMGIWEDKRGNVWIATTNGFVSKVIEKENGDLEFLSTRFFEETTDFLSFYVTENDILWIGTSNGIIRFDLYQPNIGNDDIELERVFVSSNGLVRNTINSIYVEDNTAENHSTVWAGTLTGVLKIKFTENSIPLTTQVFIDADDPHNIENRINTLYQSVDDVNYLWVGTDGGMFRIEKEKNLPTGFHQIPDLELKIQDIEKVTTFFEGRSGVIWIGTNKGVRKINKYRKDFYHIDLENNLTDKFGEIKGLTKDHQDNIFIATHGLGVVKLMLKDGEETISQMKINNLNSGLRFVNTVGIDANYNIWAGTDGNGIYKIDPSSIKHNIAHGVKYYSNDPTDNLSLSDNYIYSTLSDKAGNFWIGTYQGGLNRYNSPDDNFIVYDEVKGLKNRLSEFPIIDLAQDKYGYIWIATRGNGIYYFNPAEEKNATTEEFYHKTASADLDSGLMDNFITDLFLDDSSNSLWVGTETGLYRVNTESKKVKAYNASNGFSGDLVQSIVSIDPDELWISSRKGIIEVELSASSKDEFEKQIIRSHQYSWSDGIQNKFFNNNAGLNVKGNIVFGGLNGITLFRPEEIKNNPFEPRVALTDFELNHKSVPTGRLSDGRTILTRDINNTDHIILKHSDKIITFEFVALHYASPEKNSYAFKMEGFDEDWINTDANRRIAHYTNLPPGDYTFKVKASNNDGVWSEGNKEIKVTILPPFWVTPSAFFMYGLILIIIILIARKIAFQQINLRHKIELEKLERRRSDEIHNLELQYFTNISHEIRTPLTLILGPLEKILQMPDLNVRIMNQLQLMQHHGQRLYRLLNQLMEFRKQGKGEIKLKAAEGNVVKFVKEIFISFRGTANDRNINYRFDSIHDKINLFYDRDILEKILYNLLSNAFKYTPNKGTVSLSLDYVKNEELTNNIKSVMAHYSQIFNTDYLEISVFDTGQGISHEDLEHIFERFFRANSQNVKTAVGTGIGLALTKELVLIHRGIISVKSDLSQGSIFSVYLPFGVSHLADNEIIKNFKDSENPDNYLMLDKTSFDKVEKIVSTTEYPSEKYKLLIVEDNEDVRKYIKNIFEYEYQIIEAANGEEGIEKAQEEIPDVVISDVMMPVIDGIEMCNRLKNDEKTSHIPIILLTARTSLIFKVEGLETGADDYITKPFSPEYLEARVRNLIEQRKTLKKKFSEKVYVKPKEITLNSIDESFLQKVIEVIDENMSNSEYGIDSMCKDIGMSRMQLYRKLKAITGLSANEFIRIQRLQRAAQLLEQDQLNVSQITYEVGFNDLKYFRSRFHEHFGMTPSDYSKKNKIRRKQKENI